MTTTSTLSGRDRAILRAVSAGAAEMALGSEPDLFIDGRCCCDQSAAHHLVRAGLIAATTLGLVGQRVAAALTPAGHRALGTPLVACGRGISTRFGRVSRDDQDDLDDTAQLDQADTLDDRGVDDLLDEGISPPDRPWAVEDYGLTAREAAGHEDLDHRLARELPDVGAESANDDEFDGGTGDTADTDGETWDDQVGERRAGRLVAPDEGWVRDDEPDAWASDVGINGAGASAEEAAVHVVEDDGR